MNTCRTVPKVVQILKIPQGLEAEKRDVRKRLSMQYQPPGVTGTLPIRPDSPVSALGCLSGYMPSDVPASVALVSYRYRHTTHNYNDIEHPIVSCAFAAGIFVETNQRSLTSKTNLKVCP